MCERIGTVRGEVRQSIPVVNSETEEVLITYTGGAPVRFSRPLDGGLPLPDECRLETFSCTVRWVDDSGGQPLIVWWYLSADADGEVPITEKVQTYLILPRNGLLSDGWRCGFAGSIDQDFARSQLASGVYLWLAVLPTPDDAAVTTAFVVEAAELRFRAVAAAFAPDAAAERC
jgi:hypothetical protein